MEEEEEEEEEEERLSAARKGRSRRCRRRCRSPRGRTRRSASATRSVARGKRKEGEGEGEGEGEEDGEGTKGRVRRAGADLNDPWSLLPSTLPALARSSRALARRSHPCSPYARSVPLRSVPLRSSCPHGAGERAVDERTPARDPAAGARRRLWCALQRPCTASETTATYS